MKLLYIFDEKIKPSKMKGTRLCNPSPTGVYEGGISCIRQRDVNLWFYTKGGTTIAVDTGHINFKGIESHFEKIGIDPRSVKHVFLTHGDSDHCGGIDAFAEQFVYPNAQVYIGEKEEPYVTGKMYRVKRLGIKIPNCVRLRPGYRLLKDGETVTVSGIKVTAFHIPGHTAGHLCYIVDESILFTGDCMAVKDDGGYAFPDFFTQFPDMNKESLRKLRDITEGYNIKYACTGHSGLRTDIASLFNHIGESAPFDKKRPFDMKAPYDITL